MTSFSSHLSQLAVQIGNKFKRRQLELVEQHQELELELKKLIMAAEAAGTSVQLSLEFSPTLGGHYQCPTCWVTSGSRSSLKPIPNGGGPDLFRCACGFEATADD